VFNFSFTKAQTPTITSFSPSTGPVGTLVTIVGTNLELTTSFSIGGVSAIVVSDTSVIAGNYGDTLVGMVMPSASTGNISVTTANGTATSSNNFTVIATPFPDLQQGKKLVGTGATGTAAQGTSVAVSADGNTTIVGAYNDNSKVGAAWIYARTGGVWIQQGSKLVGTGAVGASHQGQSAAISADGTTAVVGGYTDNGNVGAVWVYVRNGNAWIQQGNKLVGTGAIGASEQGNSVSISADGNTIIVGGYNDNGNIGAIWVFTRSAGTWTQQGSKLVGTGNVGNSYQGMSVSISADGNTAIVGGYEDHTFIGAAWVYTRSGGIWTQQGSKLVGTGGVGYTTQGSSVALSADGNTALVGGYFDNSNVGAAWVFTRSGGVWTQQGSKLVGTGAIGASEQGSSVSLSADGNTAIVGGYYDNSNAGAVWIYTRSAGTWTQQGNKFVGTGAVGTAFQGNSASLSADGKTAVESGAFENSQVGAVWVFVASPIPAFSANDTVVCPGSTVQFTDKSTYGPTSWNWTFQDGANTITSTLQNPGITFYTPGQDSVKLVVANIYGADSLTKKLYITVNTTPTVSISENIIGGSKVCVAHDTLTANASGNGSFTYAWNTAGTRDTIMVGGPSPLNQGIVTTVAGNYAAAGNVDGTGTAAKFQSPWGVVADGNGNLFVSDFYNNEIRKVVLSSGAVTTFAGQGHSNPGGTNGIGTAAKFNDPYGLAVDNAGNLFVADQNSNLIRKIVIATGEVSTLAGSTVGSTDGTGTGAKFAGPAGLAYDGLGNLYVADG
ncbi:MAG TPA: PKD domain-containing protein, partial [Bacteroidia bacterium]|nr:PKD domain-containing protein [Bacteroidia bacterium]